MHLKDLDIIEWLLLIIPLNFDQIIIGRLYIPVSKHVINHWLLILKLDHQLKSYGYKN